MWYIDEGFLVWVIPSIYLSHESINYVYRWFCICFRQILLQIFGFINNNNIIIYVCLHTALSLMFYSTSLLLLSYYTMHISCVVIYFLSTCSYISILMTQFSIHALLIWIYRYTCAYPCTPLDIHHTTRWGVSDSPRSSCQDPRDWSLWILLVAYQSSAAVAWIISKPSEALSLQAAFSSLEFSFCNS